MPSLPTSALVACGLVGGFAAAKYSARREAGGAVFGVCGLLAARRWQQSAGPVRTGALVGLYAASMGGSHPLAKKIGPWPSVIAVSAMTAAAAHVVADRRAGA